MTINFKCKKCGNEIHIPEEEIDNIDKNVIFCEFCGDKMEIINLEEIVKKDINTKIKGNINKWVNLIGWDNVIDLIQRNKEQACYRLYKEELERRGFKLK